MKFLILYGSVRESRQGIKAARFIVNQIKARKHAAMLLDPKEHKFGFLDKTYKEYEKGKAPEHMEKVAEHIRHADAVVIVTGEYNHMPPPALINLLDHFLEEWHWKPSAIVSYSAGGFGGVRAASNIRDMLAELGMPAIPTNFAIGEVQDSMDDEGNAVDKGYERRITKFLDELEWYAEAFKHEREKGTPY
ncbi:MAG: NADPH-dependent FMN reductase [Nanoarchaeota archaeon]